MALVRILVDGYSLLHNWPELAPDKPRFSAAARDELIRQLTLHRDAIGVPITVIFDGSNAPAGTPKPVSTRELEVLYSPAGRTADDLIERAAYRFASYGEVMVVTDDHAEKDTVTTFGATTCSCVSFIRMIESARDEIQRDLKHFNQRERKRYRSGHG